MNTQASLFHRVCHTVWLSWLCLLLMLPLVSGTAHALTDELASVQTLLTGTNQQSNPHSSDQSEQPADSNQSAGSTTTPSAAPSVDATTTTAAIEIQPPAQAQATDQEIRQRIMGIFSEIDGLGSVQVSVTQGVVSLSGDVPNERKAQQALSLANRLSHVVTVEDGINRTLAVEDNVTPVFNTIRAKTNIAIKALPLGLMAILAFAVVAWLGSWLARRELFWQRITPNPFVAELLAQTVKVLFIVIGLILGLSLLGAEAIIGTLLGGAGVIGIAVGFAVKDTIENYIASLMLSVRQPFRARDHVVINEHEGIVVRLTSRATILMTLDGNQLRIPNSDVFKGIILNYTKNPERRFGFQLGVDANDDPLAAIKVGLDAINALDFVLSEPRALGVIDSIGDSNIVLQFQIWVDQTETDYSKARSVAIREAKHAIEQHGFSLPEPIYMLNFDQAVEDAIVHLGNQLVIAPAKTDLIQSGSHEPPTVDSSARPRRGAMVSSTSASAKDEQYRQAAKARAQQVLEGCAVDELMDTRPDHKLMQRIEEEIQDNRGEKDLLSSDSPQE